MCNEDGTHPHRLQRRDLQPRDAAAGLQARGHPIELRATPKPSFTCTRNRGTASWSSFRACSPSRSGTRAAGCSGARPPRHQAAVLRRDRHRPRVRLRDQGPAGQRPRSRGVRQSVLPEYLAMRFVAGERTFFRGIRKLLPGTVLTWTAGDRVQTHATGMCHRRPSAGGECTTGGRPDTRASRESRQDSPDERCSSGCVSLRRHRLDRLDGMMARAATSRVKTFSVGFHERDANELPYARLAADRLGTEHHEVTVTAAAFFDALPRLSGTKTSRSRSHPAFHFILLRDWQRPREGRADRRRRRRALSRLQPLPRDALECAPRTTVLGGRAARHTSWVRAAVRALPRRLGRIARRTFLALEPDIRDLYFENFAVFPLSVQQQMLRRDTARRRRSVCGRTGCFERGPWRPARSDLRVDHKTYLHRAPDETGSDEHGGIDREPRAVSRRSAGRAPRHDAR